jgi:hypothetical protein
MAIAVSFLSQLAIGKSAPPNEQKIKPIESSSVSSVHFSLNLPQASQFLGMTKGRVVTFIKGRLIGWTERKPQVRHATPDFLSSLVALANFMRL